MIFVIGSVVLLVGILVTQTCGSPLKSLGHFNTADYWGGALMLVGGVTCVVSMLMVAWKLLP